jgi:hypothetical protein
MLTPPRVLGLITAAYSVAIGVRLPDPGRRVRIGLFAAGWAALCALSARWAG